MQNEYQSVRSTAASCGVRSQMYRMLNCCSFLGYHNSWITVFNCGRQYSIQYSSVFVSHDTENQATKCETGRGIHMKFVMYYNVRTNLVQILVYY